VTPGLFWGSLDGPRVRGSHAQVVDALGGAIVRGDPPPGEPLPREEELTARLGVSRTVLREATRTLTAKGMVVSRTRVGTRVRPREHWNMLDGDVLRWHLEAGSGARFFGALSEMRLAVEPYAASLAAGRAGPEALAALRASVRRMAEAPDRRAFAIADWEFHRAVIDASQNPFMHSVGALIEAALLTSFWISSPAEDAATQAASAAEHGAIVEAIARGDAEGAAAAMRAVIATGQARVSQAT
jgi:DNA-binding FadR family transcriptional regulator